MSSAVQIKTGREVDNLRQLALRMGGLAEGILDKSLRAVWNRDQALAEEVDADDLEIDRIDIEIDAAVLSVLALRAPVASDLRQTLAIKTMATDLERIGDLARAVLGEDDDIDEVEGRVIRESIGRIQTEPTASRQEIDLIFIAKNLERIADHATNIAEEVILATESVNLKHAEKLAP